MKQYVRLLVIYVVIALAVVLLYAPWGLALRPSDVSLLRAGASIICGIGLLGTFGAATYLTLKDPDVKLLEPAKVMSDDEVIPVLEEYSDEPYVGPIAIEALAQVRSASRKRDRLCKAIGVQFSEGSLSWDKFCGLVETAGRTVLRNAALVANNVQSFDRDGYASAKRHGQSQSAHLAVYDQSLADMQEILDANERVLLEMAKLERELGRLEASDTLEENSDTVEALQSLIEDTKYYR